MQVCQFTHCGSFASPDSSHCNGSLLGSIDTNVYADCFAFCEASGTLCCGFSDYGRHPNYSRPGRCTAYSGGVQSGCNGCQIRITYASACP